MSEQRETIREAVMALVAEHTEPESLATAALERVGLPLDFRPVFFGLVRDDARRRLRERSASNAPPFERPRPTNVAPTPMPRTSPAVAPNSVTRPGWMRERFALPDGRMVTWADATVADHEARIAMQLKLAGGIKRDINNHKEAIRRCKAGGVERLADLPEYGGAGAVVAA